MEETVKMMRVSDNAQQWAAYSAAGAGNAGMGTYADGVPMVIAFQDVLTVYDTSINQIVFFAEAPIAVKKGLGQPLF